MTQTYATWSDEEESVMREHWGKPGYKPSRIAKMVGRTVNTCYAKAQYMGLTKRRVTFETCKDELIALARQRLSRKQIAAKMDISVSSVDKYGRLAGVTFPDTSCRARKDKRKRASRGGIVNHKATAANLRIPLGEGCFIKKGSKYLHMSGQSLTDSQKLAYRQRIDKAQCMALKSPIRGLVIVREPRLKFKPVKDVA